MAFNYGNFESLLPFLGGPNAANAMAGHHTNFMNPLSVAMAGTTVVPSTNSTDVPNSRATAKGNSLTASCYKVKPNQGAVPMDLENDAETEDAQATTNADNATTKSSTTTTTTQTKPSEKQTINPGLFLNGLMAAGAPPGYMFFHTAAATPTSNPTTATNPMLMDPSAFMAAAMQQMQQNYTGYPQLGENAIDGNNQAGISGTCHPPPASKEVIKTKNCLLLPPNPSAPPPTIRERPPGCRTVFVGGLPEHITEEMIREIFDACGEITTLRMSKKNFCHIRFRNEASIDRAIAFSGYRLRIISANENTSFGRLHVDYAQARDDQYEFECKQRQQQREQRHRDRVSFERLRSQSPPPIPHYTDHEASLAAENLRNNETFQKAVQTITVWLERGDCNKRNSNVFYSMIQSTHAHVRRLHTEKQQLEEDLRKARESYRRQMLTTSTQFTQIEKVFNAASHKKVWDHFTKAQRKNIDQWKKLATELRCIQIPDDEMEMSDDDRDYQNCEKRSKRTRYDLESLKEENDSLRCQLEALRNEMSLDRTDLKCDTDFREKQISVLQETIRNMQTQWMQAKAKEIHDSKMVHALERKLKEAGVRELVLKTKIREITTKQLRPRLNKETKDRHSDDSSDNEKDQRRYEETRENTEIIDIDAKEDDDDDDVTIIEEHPDVVEIKENDYLGKKSTTKEYVEGGEKQTIHNVECENAYEVKETDKNREKNDIMNFETIVENEKGGEVHILNKQTSLTEERNKMNVSTLALTEAKIIALTSAFLVVHPQGVCIESIHNYLSSMIESFKLQENESILVDILKKYTNLFKAEFSTDTKVNPKWIFCGFIKPKITIES